MSEPASSARSDEATIADLRRNLGERTRAFDAVCREHNALCEQVIAALSTLCVT